MGFEMNPSIRITSIIKDFLDNSPTNSLTGDGGEKAWDDALVGFAAGSDPIFDFLKKDIGEFYWTPAEAFALAYPERPAAPRELTVVSWILPQRRAVRQDHRRETAMPSERWSRVRHYGEACNDALRAHLVQALADEGLDALAPQRLPAWERRLSERYCFASTWSERHAAYAAGLGTFGLSDGLITPRGKAVRCGSVIVRATVPATPRPYADHHAYCLFYAEGKCAVCAKRCPAGAISKDGHDKEKCMRYIRSVTSEFVRTNQLGFPVNSCGLCQTGVPCESRIPLRPQG